MNSFTAVAIINISIVCLVGFGIYYTHDLWVLLALFFMQTAKKSKDDDA